MRLEIYIDNLLKELKTIDVKMNRIGKIRVIKHDLTKLDKTTV